jgi:hypothetical protein
MFTRNRFPRKKEERVDVGEKEIWTAIGFRCV